MFVYTHLYVTIRVYVCTLWWTNVWWQFTFNDNFTKISTSGLR